MIKITLSNADVPADDNADACDVFQQLVKE
jgi:hypothetical protein